MDDDDNNCTTLMTNKNILFQVDISLYTENIWVALFAHAECPEEGTRNVVAECLGRKTVIYVYQ